MRPDFPLPDRGFALTAPFWDAAEHGELALPVCTTCDRITWYPAERCRHCGAPTLDWQRVDGGGRVFSWTVVERVLLPAFADDVPYLTGLVSLDRDPEVRLVTRLVDVEPDDLRIDLPVDLHFLPLAFSGVEGTVTAPVYRPRPLTQPDAHASVRASSNIR